MRVFGLIGNPLTHSFSKKYFEEKFLRESISECTYELYPLNSIAEFLPLVKSTDCLNGLNVTIPYKESVMDYLDEVDAEAVKIDAVNCIKIRNGKTKGYNTDAFGFENSLREFLRNNGAQLSGLTAFVLGTGGAAKAVNYVLNKINVPHISVSREERLGMIDYVQIEEHLSKCNLFVNTTPLGMYPDSDTCPAIPYDKLSSKDFLFDLVYNPAETLFLKKGREKGAFTENGLKMLELQAEKSWQIWNS